MSCSNDQTKNQQGAKNGLSGSYLAFGDQGVGLRLTRWINGWTNMKRRKKAKSKEINQ